LIAGPAECHSAAIEGIASYNSIMKTWLSILAVSCTFSLGFAGEMAIDIEVVLTPDAPITAPQQWAQKLGKLGLDSVQIRSAHGEEKPSTKLNDSGTRVEVLAVLTGRDELVMYDRRFRANQVSELKAYFEKLPAQIAEQGVVRGPFGLTEEEFRTVMADMMRPLGVSTNGRTSRDLLSHCANSFRLPIKLMAVDTLLRDVKPLQTELESFAAGTALAIALRDDGLTIHPENIAGGLQLVVSPYQRGRKAWPVGWKAERSPRQLAPKLFESLTFEIENYTLAAALTALAPRLTVPVVMDDWSLARLDIHPDKIPVKLPPKKTFLMNAVDKMLSQARLGSELRVDDAGKPFLWVTQYGPDSRPAE
jgi:hypothetical protein